MPTNTKTKSLCPLIVCREWQHYFEPHIYHEFRIKPLQIGTALETLSRRRLHYICQVHLDAIFPQLESAKLRFMSYSELRNHYSNLLTLFLTDALGILEPLNKWLRPGPGLQLRMSVKVLTSKGPSRQYGVLIGLCTCTFVVLRLIHPQFDVQQVL
jgi:hypothetical protein